jgi:hypothetical protein
MKVAFAVSLAANLWLELCSSAFQPLVCFTSPSPLSVSFKSKLKKSSLFSDPAGDNEGLDLDLGEMFEMFEAADEGQDFDKTLEKVKGSSDN